jgi:Tol biopolymer transport system component/cytochrome c biogenesis protein CcdA
VAAYLVGAKGTTLHAISLGAIVTLTHTGSVFSLGLIALAASQYILPTSLFPVLEITSGLLIVGLGGYLLYNRWVAHRAGQHHHHDHSHHHDHDHHHHHDHVHDHDHHHHHHDIPDNITWRSLIMLGVSGGLVPCPDAIAILLIAITINRILLGLSLIVAFSLGLALVLIVIGLALVHSRRLFDRMDAFNRVAPVMPLVSAVIVLLLGVALTYNAISGPEVLAFGQDETVAIETTAEKELPQAEAQAKRDSIDEAKILYIAQDDRHHPQLVVHPLSNNEPKFITQAPSGIRTYYLSPDGDKIVYTTQRDDGGSELWSMSSDGSDQRQLLVCPEVSCGGVAWSPDAQRIVYEKREIASSENPLGLPSLWWFAVDSGETQLVFPNSQWSGFNPTWSPDGQWLSYTSAGSGKIELYNLIDGRRHSLDNQTGGNVEWHPNSKSILFQDVRAQPEGFFIHRLHFDLDSGAIIDLSEPANAEDSSVAWSPDGEQIAVVRRILTDSNSARGNQIWVMRPDGNEAQQLTNQPDIFYSTLTWSPDGKHLLFQQASLGENGGKSEIWMITVETSQLQHLGSGRWPNWLP